MGGKLLLRLNISKRKSEGYEHLAGPEHTFVFDKEGVINGTFCKHLDS